MWPPERVHFALVYSISWLNYEIFFSYEKKKMKLSPLRKNVHASSHGKGSLMALTAIYQFELWLKVRDMLSKLSLARQGPWNLVWVKQVFELSEVELTEFHCALFLLQLNTSLDTSIEDPRETSASHAMLSVQERLKQLRAGSPTERYSRTHYLSTPDISTTNLGVSCGITQPKQIRHQDLRN